MLRLSMFVGCGGGRFSLVDIEDGLMEIWKNGSVR